MELSEIEEKISSCKIELDSECSARNTFMPFRRNVMRREFLRGMIDGLVFAKRAIKIFHQKPIDDDQIAQQANSLGHRNDTEFNNIAPLDNVYVRADAINNGEGFIEPESTFLKGVVDKVFDLDCRGISIKMFSVRTTFGWYEVPFTHIYQKDYFPRELQ